MDVWLGSPISIIVFLFLFLFSSPFPFLCLWAFVPLSHFLSHSPSTPILAIEAIFTFTVTVVEIVVAFVTAIVGLGLPLVFRGGFVSPTPGGCICSRLASEGNARERNHLHPKSHAHCRTSRTDTWYISAAKVLRFGIVLSPTVTSPSPSRTSQS